MSVVIAPFLSFLLNGLGQIYNGQVRKGIIFIVVSFLFTVVLVFGIVLLFRSFILSIYDSLDFVQLTWGVILVTVSGFVLCLNGLLSIIDAYKVAKKNANQSKSHS